MLVAAEKPFVFEGNPIRTAVQDDGQLWFAATDVCGLLDIENSSDTIGRLDDEEKGVAKFDTLGGKQTLGVVNESGLYHLITKSTKPQAKAFRQ